ncbi:O-antigen polymerase [Dyadobacter sp. OTU695]|uniref:O-antigen polymerase n=1 Tax=Dyadobacter sp. OTU695 TaxID=3043860 RepID=UPI00313B0ED6
MGNEFFVRAILDNWLYYGAVYAGFLCLYLFLYRKIYWGILDPLLLTVINLTGGAFCVYFLYSDETLKPIYGWSFVGTEIALFLGLTIAAYIPVVKLGGNTNKVEIPTQGISEFDVFLFVLCIAYVLVEVINLKTVGIVLLNKEENHVSVYGGHGIIRAFVTSYRTLVIMSLYYKVIYLKKRFSLFEIFICGVLLLDIVTSGSKSAIIVFFVTYFLITYPMVIQGRMSTIKLSLPLIIVLLSFPVAIVMISVGADASSAIQQVGLRLMSSGDIFLLGYYDDVMDSIQESSFFKYAFYPGWGTILKNLGFEIIPPEPIGVDVFAFYSGRRTSGANGRYNYLAYHFFGLWGGIIYALIIGLLVGYLRSMYKSLNPLNMNYYSFLFMVVLISCSTRLIDDILLFGNTSFWALLFLTVSYVVAKILYMVLQVVTRTKSYA